ncbi:MAG: S1 RNA-binding domain-containing protein [Candidatus Pacebacteria bacterium]|nr:S1 RNA-binding domain-containing protein [Candidatus Paceibacterota bacterium]
MIAKKIIQETDSIKIPRIGDILEGQIINQKNAVVYLDLKEWGVGVIFGKEFYEAKNRLRKLKKGDSVFTKVIKLFNEDGYLELSLNQAGEEMAWKTIKEKKSNNEIIKIKITGANKGGLLAEVSGIPAFLPVSQLSPINYPKVKDGDNQKILQALQDFIGQELEVKVFDTDPKEGKLILSEKAKESEKIKEFLKNYNKGDIVEGEITGVVDFGAFIKFGQESLEGLIHISELSPKMIKNPSEIVKIGDIVKAKIIEISNNKIFLSLKDLN